MSDEPAFEPLPIPGNFATSRPHTSQSGFTLVELMIVIAMIGILALVAIPTYLRFSRKSKTSEVSVNLSTIAKGAVGWYQRRHTTLAGNPQRRSFPSQYSPYGVGDSSNRRPLDPPCKDGQPLYTRDKNRWMTQPWKSLQFSLDKAHYFQYHYTVDNPQSGQTTPPSAVIEGFADIDCDGLKSHYTLKLNVRSTDGEVERSNIIVQNGLE